MAPIIVGSVWKLMTTPSIGIIPHYLENWFGLTVNIGQSRRHAAFITTVIMDVWHWTPLVTLTLIAALVSLPPTRSSRRRSTAPTSGRSSGTSPCR
jgi:multiple sugar transport system permease protein